MLILKDQLQWNEVNENVHTAEVRKEELHTIFYSKWTDTYMVICPGKPVTKPMTGAETEKYISEL